MPVDPSAVKTWANLVTVARVILAPLMLVLIPDDSTGSWAAFILWFVLCGSDGIDGADGTVANAGATCLARVAPHAGDAWMVFV